jgi:hypothetical protein
MNHRILRLLMLIAFCAPLSGHTEDFMDRVKIRRSVIDKNIVEKPAELFFQSPEDGKDVYSVDAGLSIDLTPAESVDHLLLAPTLEYHRQTQTDKEQDTLQAGLTAIYLWGDVTESAALFSQASAKYKKDGVKNTEGAQISLDLTPVAPDLLIGRISTSCPPVTWQPALGVEVEDVAQAKDEDPTGTITRGKASVEVGLYPFDDRFGRNKQLELLVSFTHWQDANESGGLDNGDDTHELFKASATYYINADRNVGLGIEFKKGENPSEGMADQELTQVSVKIKY